MSQMQDWLGVGAEGRMNEPGVLGHGNWCWRMDAGAATEDLALPRQAIRLFAASMQPSGLTQSRFPSRDQQTIPAFSLYFLLMLEDYVLHTGDENFVRPYIPVAERIVETFLSRRTAHGLLAPQGYWDYFDWTKEWSTRTVACTPNAALDGESTLQNLFFVYACRSLIRLLPQFDRAKGVYQYRAGLQAVQSGLCGGDPFFQFQQQFLRQIVQLLHHLLTVRHGELRSVGRGRRPSVRRVVRDGNIGFMSDGGDHGDPRLADGARHLLRIEAPEVLQGPSSPAADDHIGQIPTVHIPQRSGDLGRRFRALYGHGKDDDLAQRPPPPQDAGDVHDRGSRP